MLLTHENVLTGMTAALAHEIKNPAALALAHVSLLRSGADLQTGCDRIAQALETIVDLAQEMLSVTGGEPLAFDFDLQEVLSEVVHMYQAAQPRVRFVLNPQAGPLTIRAPEVCVRMIFSNLIKNAVEAVTADKRPFPEIDIFAGAKDGWAYIIIRDNGPGCDDGALESQSKKPHGNGMGLPITRWLLARMGGDLKLRAGALGGCEAVVRLRV